IYNKGATRQIKEKEVYSALKMWNDKAMLTQRESLEHWQGWEYKPTKRNGRKRAIHMKYMNNQRAFKVDMGECTNGGRPIGSGTAEQTVRTWRELNPQGKPKECMENTGLNKNTVYKWWK
ncbi:MAG: hypothetical protein RR744_10125, partial [Cellulosilyticaceae bacterium]